MVKWFWPDLSSRADDPELMDEPAVEPAELVESLDQLRLINRLLGAAWPTIEGIHRLWEQAGCPKRLSLLDIGTGSGDIADHILKWADRRGLELQLTLLDLQPYTCALVASRYQTDARVSVIQGNIRHLGIRRADIVTASLFLHHFPNRQLATVLSEMQQAAHLGVVVNDLHRHRFAWAFIRAATRLLSDNRLIRHDAPLSVRRGFRAAELDRLKNDARLEQLTYGWRPLFRYLIILPATNALETRIC